MQRVYAHPHMSDGHLNKCKACSKKDVARRYINPEARQRIIAYERRRAQDPRRKAKALEYQRRMRARRPGKYRARQKIGNGVRD